MCGMLLPACRACICVQLCSPEQIDHRGIEAQNLYQSEMGFKGPNNRFLPRLWIVFPRMVENHPPAGVSSNTVNNLIIIYIYIYV